MEGVEGGVRRPYLRPYLHNPHLHPTSLEASAHAVSSLDPSWRPRHGTRGWLWQGGGGEPFLEEKRAPRRSISKKSHPLAVRTNTMPRRKGSRIQARPYIAAAFLTMAPLPCQSVANPIHHAHLDVSWRSYREEGTSTEFPELHRVVHVPPRPRPWSSVQDPPLRSARLLPCPSTEDEPSTCTSPPNLSALHTANRSNHIDRRWDVRRAL